MNKWLTGMAFAIIFSLAPIAHADLNEQVLNLCDKMKTCIYEQAGGQELPPQMKEAIEGAFEQQCKQTIETYATNIEDSGLEDEANACVSSLLERSCGEIMSGNGNLTPDCETFEQAANEAGLDVGE